MKYSLLQHVLHEKGYRSYFTVFIVLCCATIVGSIVTSTIFFERQYRLTIDSQTDFLLRQAASLTEQMDETAKSSLLSMSTNRQVQDLFSYGAESAEQIMPTLVEISNSYIGDGQNLPKAYFYFVDFNRRMFYSINTPRKIYSFGEQPDEEIVELLSLAGHKDKFRRIARLSPFAAGGKESVFTYCYFEGSQPQYSGNAIVVNFEPEWLLDRLTDMCENSDGFFLYRQDGEYIGHSGYFDRKDLSQMASLPDPNRKFVVLEGTKYAAIQNSAHNMVFLYAANSKVINSPIMRMRTTSLIIACILAVIAFFSVYPLSIRSYYRFKRQLQPVIPNQHNLYTLLQRINNAANDEDFTDEIRRTAGECGIDLHALCCCVTFSIDSYYDFKRHYPKEEQSSIRFAFLNIIEETYRRMGMTYAFRMRENFYLALLCNLPQGMDANEIVSNTKTIQQYISKYFNYTVSATVSSLSPFTQIKNIYWDARLTCEYHYLQPEQSLLHTVDFHTSEEAASPVSVAVQNACEKLLNTIELNGLLKLLQQQVFPILPKCSPNDARHGIAVIINLTKIAAFEYSERFGIELGEYTEQLAELASHSWKLQETVSRYTELIHRLRDHLTPVISEQAVGKGLKITQAARKIVERRYSDSNLTVTAIADELNLSSVYLCKLFKTYERTQLNNFISEYRIQRAAELLENTSLTIKSVSEHCGFINTNYFYTLFRKYKGITATEYKKRFGK